MSLAEKIQKDLVDAMRAKEELRLSVLRGIKAAIKHKEVEKIRALDETECIQILQTLVKQRKESIDQFTKGNRPELAAKETKELAIIESYLPAGASEAEMDAAITRAISETGANSIKQMGGVVKAAKTALEGKTVDGKTLSDRVRDRLSKLSCSIDPRLAPYLLCPSASPSLFFQNASPGNHRSALHRRRRRLCDRAPGCEADLPSRRTHRYGCERDGKRCNACRADSSRRHHRLQRVSLLVGRLSFGCRRTRHPPCSFPG